MILDTHGQPSPRFNRDRLAGRSLDELIGLCRGIVADGEVTAAEAKFLYEWMESSRALVGEWPASVLFRRVHEMLVDHALDPSEQMELLGLIDDIVGDRIQLPSGAVSASTSLPLDNPAPAIEFSGKYFCVTGRFIYGSRKQVTGQIESRGGLIHGGARKSTDYLVVGVVASRDWIHSTHGRKIQEAVDFRDSGCPVRIVSEIHWAAALT